MLATPAATLPGPAALTGGSWYEPKFDGYRALVFVDDIEGRRAARVQSRRGADLSDAFPDVVAAAAAQLPGGTVVDGELVIWTHGRPDFPALQRRLAQRRNAGALAEAEPANLLVFDVLAVTGLDQRARPFRVRRRLLERLAQAMSPPLQMVPGTREVEQAAQWLADYGRAEVGVEGLVVKGLAMPYVSGQRGWLKYKMRDTVEAVVGAVIGSPENAERLILGRYNPEGDLRMVGSTHPLRAPQRLELREHLFSAVEHPWPTDIPAGGLGHWGGRERIAIHRVEPTLVVEISADRAFEHGRWRHLTRYLRVRVDLDPTTVGRGPVGGAT
jgi:ATP-dependent DNA ligase